MESSSRENQNFPTTGRPPDRDWMDTKRTRPTWMGNEARNTVDSGSEFTENRYGLLPLQPGGRKHHAEDDTLLREYADIPDSTRSMPWDGPHKRILFESEDPDSTVSGSDTQEARPGWPRRTCAQIRLGTRGHLTTETVRDYGYLVQCFSRECLSYRGI